MPVNHHEHDEIVELCRVPSRFEADVIVAKLRDAGVTASTSYGEIAGYLRGIGLLGGNQVLVFDCDVERAQRVLAEADDGAADDAPAPAPPPAPPAPTGRGRRRY